MDVDKKDLAAGILEMRSVAKRLMEWADDMEKAAAPAADSAPAVPTLAEVKAFLTGKCAAGYSAQVKALIASFGVSSLSEVPAEALGALMDAALLLGAEEGEDLHAG